MTIPYEFFLETINNSVGCVLLGDMVNQKLPYLKEGSVEPLMIIAQFFKSNRRLFSNKPSNSARISQVSSHGPRFGADELRNGDVVEGPTWIASTIVSINAGKDDWFYKFCQKCLKKVDTLISNRYECGKCSHTHGSRSRTGKMVQLCERQVEQIKNEEIIQNIH
ncbi:hypothetical protein Ahy_A03g013817 [Arachis hypogaea]|uniref:Replication factor A C-terminal domain-containing protein n=1 Tax=Arachis hypogaea TaxID=3818 RepID=A0A445DW91_ARAHY|nr:hypothetical protein Ahy_A03g013817 [Arachis hypogaea]